MAKEQSFRQMTDELMKRRYGTQADLRKRLVAENASESGNYVIPQYEQRRRAAAALKGIKLPAKKRS